MGMGTGQEDVLKIHTFVYKAIYRNSNNEYLKGGEGTMPMYSSCNWE